MAVNPATDWCPLCGHRRGPARCGRCQGTAIGLDGRTPLHAGRGGPLADLLRGGGAVLRAAPALLHHRAFVGRLALPVALNALAFLLLAGLLWFVVRPWCDALFAAPWRWGDGLRTLRGDYGSAAWLTTIWLLLAPPLLELIAGPAQEALLDAAEGALFGPGEPSGDATGMLLRLRDRAQVVAGALLVLPLALVVSLVPWIGLPVAGVLGAAIAAVVWFEPVLARRGFDLRARLELLWRNRWRALGVGGALQFAAAVPFLNLLGLSSVAALAASSAFVQFEKRRVVRSPR